MTPDSLIFRLPALTHADVRLWMRTEFPAQMVALEAAAGDPICLEWLQNSILKQSIQHLVISMGRQADEVARLRAIVQHCTAAFSPPKAPIGQRLQSGQHGPTLCIGNTPDSAPFDDIAHSLPSDLAAPFELLETYTDGDPRVRTTSVEELFVDSETRTRQDNGTYQAEDAMFRAFVAPSPVSPVLARPRTDVDLVLPSALAFTRPGVSSLRTSVSH